MGIVVLELELESYISVDQKESSFPKTMTIYVSGWDTSAIASERTGWGCFGGSSRLRLTSATFPRQR